LRPTLEETTNYKTWWGKTIIKIFDLVEGELNASDPLSKIFFISDGLMTMLNDKYKIEFARHIANVASEQPDDEIVPDYFVENELRNWLNEKFFLDPPLQPKNNSNDEKSIEKISETIMTISKKILLESYNYDSMIRQIVKDIVTIYKREEDGEFYLPEDINDEEYEYEFKDLSIAVELYIEISYNIDGFLLNAEYYSNEDIMAIKIIYNPDNKLTILYDMIGELNELVAHELRHSHQKTTGSYELTPDTDEDQGLNYYTKPHEIDAQYYGFKRMSKITGKPFEEVVRNWFDTHRDIHQMNKFDSNKVINKILNHKTN